MADDPAPPEQQHASPDGPHRDAVADGPYDPTWASLETHPVPDWFHDATFGVYFHWGPYAVPAFDSEWYPRHMYQSGTDVHAHHRETYGDPAGAGYREFIPEFHGDAFDADRWAALCADAGAEFVGVTAIHHDGFALWDSDLTPYNAAAMGPERDVLGELAAAVRERDMKFVAAFHHAYTWWYYPRDPAYDTTDPDHDALYGGQQVDGEDPPPSYYADWRDTVAEVVDAYRPDLLWFDFGLGKAQFVEHDRYRREMVAHYYNRAAEWGTDVDVAHKRNLPVGVGVVDYERSRRDDLSLEPWLTDTSIDRASWGYVDDPDYKSAGTMIRGLVDRTSKFGATLLNVGPRADGTIPDPAAERLRAVGAWLETNGEAVSGVRPWWTFGEGPTEVVSDSFEAASGVSFTAEDLRFTRSPGGDVAYAVVMDWPEDATVTVETSLSRRLAGHFRGNDPAVPERVTLLGGGDEPLPCTLDEETDALRITLPDEPPAGTDVAYALRLDLPERGDAGTGS